MDLFATETWIHVVQFLRKRDCVNLSTTCRTFRKVGQEQLYQHVLLEGSGIQNDDDTLFARSLDGCPPLAALVCTFVHGPMPRRLGAGTASFEAFTSSPALSKISTFSNLRTLELSSIVIDEGLYAAIRVLPRLHKVKYDECIIDPGLDALQMAITWGLSLSTVIICDPNPLAERWAVVIPPTVRSLKIQEHLDTAYSGFQVDTLFSKLMQHHQPLEFTTLIFSQAVPDNITAILMSCPQLREVSFPTPFQTDIIALLTLPSHAVPCLEYFSGSSTYIESFVSGRPIHSATISLLNKDRDDILLGLRHSLVPMTKLEVTAINLKLQWLECAPSTLHTLEVNQGLIFDHYSDTSDVSWLPALSQMPNLRILRVFGPRFSRAQQEELVGVAAAVCGSARIRI